MSIHDRVQYSGAAEGPGQALPSRQDRMKRELAGLSYADQLARVRPPPVPALQMMRDPVQFGGGGTVVPDWTAGSNIDDLLDSGGTHHQGRFPHSGPANGILYRKKEDGSVTAYMVFDGSGKPVKRVDVDASSAAHAGVPPPHSADYVDNTNPQGQTFRTESKMARPCRPEEVPSRKH